MYNLNGNKLSTAYDSNGSPLSQVYDFYGNIVMSENVSVGLDATEWYVNQCGYDTDKTKRATVPNMSNGVSVMLVDANTNKPVNEYSVSDGIVDFSNAAAGTYYLANGISRSYDFKIAENRIFDISVTNAIEFMSQARQDTFDVGASTGYAWRDSHQFTFELNSLAMMYMSNPTYYNSVKNGIYRVEECEYEELRTQTEPDIVWLMKFGVMRYYDWNVNKSVTLHALIKGQIAYFLYIYPHISDYVDAGWYATIRDWAISQWSVATCNKLWYEVDGGINHSLFETQAKIGTLKGQLPPGYAIVPNLMMYEVAKRDGLDNADDFMVAATNNINWLVNDVDLTDPANTKGQRMSEYITFHALTYAYEMYPSQCPSATYSKILEIANLMITRSGNMWDYAQYQTAGESDSVTTTVWVNNGSDGLNNQPGNVAGFMAVAYSLARVITDTTVKARLKELAVSHIDHVYGRNPLGRHFCHDATTYFDGAKVGWVSEHINGYGSLDWVQGVLDGSPKNTNYPYNPNGDTGYTEGWVAFNSAWNMSLAYLCGENEEITDGIGIFAN